MSKTRPGKPYEVPWGKSSVCVNACVCVSEAERQREREYI